jgi:hypothetical protein
MPSYDRALWALRMWLDSRSGVGHVVGGMARQGYDLQLTRHDERGEAAYSCAGSASRPDLLIERCHPLGRSGRSNPVAVLHPVGQELTEVNRVRPKSL